MSKKIFGRLCMDKIREALRQDGLGEGIRAIARNLKISRNTVRKYLIQAKKLKLNFEPKIENKELLILQQGKDFKEILNHEKKQNELDQLLGQWLSQKQVTLIRCWQEAKKLGLYSHSYVAFTMYIRKLQGDAKLKNVFIPIETAPGEEAQVDFINGPNLYNPSVGKVMATSIFVMTMGYSRADFAMFVWSQNIRSWITCHEKAFRFFGGVPSAIRCDNLKSAIIKALFIEAELNRTYCEFASYYGFIVRNCKVRVSRHKGKVERLGQYIQTSFLPLRQFKFIEDANQQLLEWLQTVANLRTHGVTLWIPWEEFEKVEKPYLKPLPENSFDIGLWGKACAHQDCHLVIDKRLYSVPYRLRGKKLDYRITQTTVQIFYQYECIAIHQIAMGKCFRKTNTTHLPPEKQAYFERTPQWCLEQAEKMGENVLIFIQKLLSKNHPLEYLRSAQGVIRLGFKYNKDQLNAACKRALTFNNITYRAIDSILKKGLENKPISIRTPQNENLSQNPRFKRGSSYFH